MKITIDKVSGVPEVLEGKMERWMEGKVPSAHVGPRVTAQKEQRQYDHMGLMIAITKGEMDEMTEEETNR